MSAIRLYCGITETKWNYHPVDPGSFGCVSPVMGAKEDKVKPSRVFVPSDTTVIQDSGAFCDGIKNRLSLNDAVDRQIIHARKNNYEDKIELRASYDLLIDEKWYDGNRVKERWNEDDAEYAVKETILSAEYLTKTRNGLSLILSAQGVTTRQYIQCAKSILPLMNKNDVFGLGGWCIIGMKKNRLKKSFNEIMMEVVPLISEAGIKRIHIWGVIYPHALGELLWLCDKHSLMLSTDSSGPQKRPIFGVWGYGDWIDKSYVAPTVKNRGQERARHVKEVIKWLSSFRETRYYKEPNINEIWR